MEFDFGVDKPVSHQIMSNLVKISILLHNKISQTSKKTHSIQWYTVMFISLTFLHIAIKIAEICYESQFSTSDVDTIASSLIDIIQNYTKIIKIYI